MTQRDDDIMSSGSCINASRSYDGDAWTPQESLRSIGADWLGILEKKKTYEIVQKARTEAIEILTAKSYEMLGENTPLTENHWAGVNTLNNAVAYLVKQMQRARLYYP